MANNSEAPELEPQVNSGWKRMEKDEINERPIGRYEGKISLIRSEDELHDAVRILEKESLLGFDTETRPSYRVGESYPPALLQLAGANEVFIFQLKFTGLPRPLLDILANPNIIKAGVSLGHDIKELRSVAEFEPAGFVDIGNVAKDIGIQNHGLRGLAAVLLGFRITKSAKTTNWSRDDFTQGQIQYAATDAWVGRELYKEIQKLRKQEMYFPS
ncbi:MAG: 3'-5' exonuclease [Victivallales bacterium]